MVNDPLRTPVLEKAIGELVKPGDVVFDLGCGLGILTFAALKAGAKKVYACDIDRSALNIAIKTAKQKNLMDRIVFFNDLSSNVILPEKVDVLLAETVGSLGLDENIVPFVIDARTRLLKKGGKILPAKMNIWAAPMGQVIARTASPDEAIQILDRRRPVSHRRDDIKQALWTTELISSNSLLSSPQKYTSIDFHKIKSPFFDKEMVFKIKDDSSLAGFAIWFDVEWAPGFSTSTSPDDPATHWKQGMLWNKKELKLKKDQELLFRLIMGPQNEFFDTQSLTEWGFRVI